MQKYSFVCPYRQTINATLPIFNKECSIAEPGNRYQLRESPSRFTEIRAWTAEVINTLKPWWNMSVFSSRQFVYVHKAYFLLTGYKSK